jgi:hypothetical protein
MDPKVNDKFLAWLKTKYASDNIRELKAVRGKIHNYLAMTLDFKTPGVLKVDMTQYIYKILSEFPETLNRKSKCLWIMQERI